MKGDCGTMERLVELVRHLEPGTAPPPPGAQARQRAALARSTEAAGQARPGPGRRRPPRGGWHLAITGAAAAAVIGAVVTGAVVVPSWLGSPRTTPEPVGPAPSPAPGASVGTSAVLAAVTRALAATGDDVEEVRSTEPVGQLDSTSWVDLATGACRTDTAVGGKPTLTVFVEAGHAVVVDYVRRQWWSRGSEGVTCGPLTPQAIEQGVAAGHYSLAGHGVLDGRPALRLASTAATSGLHPVTKPTTLWVDATTFLPIQSTSVGHGSEKTVFAWLPATAGNRAVLHVAVPTGFRHVAPPPVQRAAP